MKWVFYLSAAAALLYSAFRIDTAGRLWVLPAAFAVFFVLWSLLFWLALALFSLCVPKGREYSRLSVFYHRLLNLAYDYLCSGAGARVHTSGLEKLPKDTCFLLVSNHLSRFDPMTQSLALKNFPIAFISKPENFWFPFDRLLNRNCYLPIDRDNPRSALKTIRHAAALVSAGAVSMGVYPEGHRGSGSTLQPFKPGCLKIAVEADCPIVVSTIAGTEQIHRRFPFRHTEVHFDILEVIYPEGRRTQELSELIAGRMQAHLRQVFGEDGAEEIPGTGTEHSISQ
jgi:1-acyl-sn-glycerol-3-phosphate acyltransferase